MTRRRLAVSTFAALVVAASPAAALETGDLGSLRAAALEQVNQVRREHGLAPLETAQSLQDAAQAHAEAMVTQNFYAHQAPDGSTPMDRVREHGGSRWQVVRENIARCDTCAVPPTHAEIKMFQQGWMNSPEHRRNILAPGLDRFGFGIAGEGAQAFAVQDFSGAGTPRGLDPGTAPTAIAPEAYAERAAAAVNAARRKAGVEPASASAALSEAARELLPEAGSDAMMRDGVNLAEVLPRGRSWGRLDVMATACGGCGAEPTTEDIDGFVGRWLDNARYRDILLDPSLGVIGFAMRADGDGRKVGIAVTGR